MAVQTLGDLRSRLRSWSNRKDLSDDLLDDFINIAQSRLNRLLRIPPLESTILLTPNADGVVPIPRSFIEMKAVWFTDPGGKKVRLERKESDYVEELAAHQEGTPKYFSRKGLDFHLAPKPTTAADDSLELYYYISLQPLTLASDSNWFLADAPEVILYGALTEIALYLRDEIGAGQWEAKFQNHAKEIQNIEDNSAYSGSSIAINGTQ